MNPEYKNTGDVLDRLAEECAEVIKEIMKCKRFGNDGSHPIYTKGKTNIELLFEEIDDTDRIIREVKEKFGKTIVNTELEKDFNIALDLIKSLSEQLNMLIQNEAFDECDHSLGICYCFIKEIIQKANNFVLRKQML